jgi:integrase
MGMKQISAGTWRLDIREWHDGREYRCRRNVEGSHKAARAIHDEEVKKLHAKVLRKSNSLTISTFGQALSAYTTRNDIGSSAPLFDRLQKDLGHVAIEELAARYDRWAGLMRHAKGQRTGRQLAAATLNRYLAWSCAALNLCVRHGFIEVNPLRHLRKHREIPRSRILSEEEKARLLDVVQREAPHLSPLLSFTLQVPCRRGEVLAMRREWYDPFNGTITIPAEHTKNKMMVVKPVPPDCRAYFQGVLRTESPHLFYRMERGRYVPLGNFRKSLGRCLRHAGINDWHFHDGRRQAYTALILGGNSPAVVQKVSGHRTDMSKVYLNIGGMQAAAAVKFGREDAISDPKPDTLTGHLKTAISGSL